MAAPSTTSPALTGRDGTCLLLLAGALAAALGGALWPGRTLFARDLTYQFHPMYVWTAESLQAGRLPLWNPYVSAGVPWLGQPQTAVFYPGGLAFWLFSFVGGLKIFHALHFFLSALGGYLWARDGKSSRVKALAAGLLWSLNGFWRARAEFPPLLAALAWTPWFGLLLRRRSAAFLGMAGALALTAGYWPQVLWSGVLALAAGGFRRARAAWKVVPWAAVLSAAALLPGLELVLRSSRLAGMEEAIAGNHALSPVHWAALLWPWAGGWQEAAYTGEKFFWLGCFFVGTAAAFRAALAFRAASRRDKWIAAALFAAGAALSLGEAGPFFSLLYQLIPARYPGQFSFWMVGAVLLLITRGENFRPRRETFFLLVVVAELFVYGWNLTPTLSADYFHRTPAWVRTAQSGPGRLFLTPKAAADMEARGATLEGAWDFLRAKGLNLSLLPYHVPSVNPYGFALNPASTEKILADLYDSPSYGQARPLLDRLNVRWVASPAPLAAPELAPAGKGMYFLYKRAPAAGAGLSVMADPGWTAWGPDRRTVGDDGGFLTVDGRAPEAAVHLLFRPAAFRIGLLLSLAGWSGFALWGLARSRCP